MNVGGEDWEVFEHGVPEDILNMTSTQYNFIHGQLTLLGVSENPRAIVDGLSSQSGYVAASWAPLVGALMPEEDPQQNVNAAAKRRAALKAFTDINLARAERFATRRQAIPAALANMRV